MQHTLFSPFNPDEPLVLALSGGADSTYLGEMFFWGGFTNVIVAHFEHGLRGDESKGDQAFCQQQASRWKWKFETESWTSPQPSEEKARRARYEFLERVRAQHNSRAIVVAHHQDDQVETIFFQFLRGTGISGLRGMKRWNKGTKIFRPLLGHTKQEILDFLKNNTLSFREESSNRDPHAYDRNFLRLTVLPLLDERFPSWKKCVLRNSDLCSQIEDFIEPQIEKALADLIKHHSANELSFSRQQYIALPQFVRGEVLRKIFTPHSITGEQIRRTDDFIHSAQSGKKTLLLMRQFQIYADHIFVTFT